VVLTSLEALLLPPETRCCCR